MASQVAEGPTPKKSQYIKDGEAICQGVPQEYEVLLQKLSASQKGKKNVPKGKALYEERTLKAAVPPLEDAVEEFIALGAPAGDEKTAAKIVEALEDAVVGFEKKPSSPLAGPESPFVEFSKLTKSYGFKLCPQL